MTVVSAPSTTLYPARTGATPLTAEHLWAIPRVGNPVPSPDGATVAVAITTYDMEKNEGRSRIWLVPAKGTTPGEPRALTAAEFSSGEPAFSPEGRRLAFTRKDAKKKAQLHVMALDGGEGEKLTDLPLGCFDPKWLPDGSGIVFGAQLLRGFLTPEATAAELERRDKDPVKAHVTEERIYRFWDTWLTTGEVPHLFVLELATRKLRDLTPDSVAWFDWMDPAGRYDIAPDGSELAYEGTIIERIYVTVVSSDDGGAVVLTWRQWLPHLERFITALRALRRDALPSVLVQMMFAYVENTYFSAEWWDSLGENHRDHIRSLARIEPYCSTPFEYMENLAVPWRILGLSERWDGADKG